MFSSVSFLYVSNGIVAITGDVFLYSALVGPGT